MLRFAERFSSLRPVSRYDHRRQLAQAIVDTVREPLVALDTDLRVIAASQSFYRTFQVKPEETEGHLLSKLGDGVWHIPALQALLRKILPEHGVMNGYEVRHEFPGLGPRSMLLNAREISDSAGRNRSILLAIEDITERRAEERELQRLLEQKDLLLEEMQHRLANSLQIIASILMLNSRSVRSEEARSHLRDAHARVMSLVAVQKHLQLTGRIERIPIGPYLSKLCSSLTKSMVSAERPILLEVAADDETLLSTDALSVGLIVAESVINALKHAFPEGSMTAGKIAIAYRTTEAGWTLSIEDNGRGIQNDGHVGVRRGLGTTIVNALAERLGARVKVSSGGSGTTVSVTHDGSRRIGEPPKEVPSIGNLEEMRRRQKSNGDTH